MYDQDFQMQRFWPLMSITGLSFCLCQATVYLEYPSVDSLAPDQKTKLKSENGPFLLCSSH